MSGPDSLAVEARVVALPMREDGAPPGPLGERVRSLLDEDGFRAQAGNAVILHLPPDAGVERVAVGGLGSEIDADAVRTAAGGIARVVEPIGGTLSWVLDEALPLTALIDGLRAVILEGATLAEIRHEVLLLVVWGVVPFAITLRVFRWR